MKNDHPLNHVKFFDTKSANKDSYKLDAVKLASMLPKENMTWTIRCFLKP